MHDKGRNPWTWAPTALLAVGGVMTVVIAALRAALLPLLRDSDTGRFSTNTVAIAAGVLTLAVLAALGFFASRERVDIPAPRALPSSLAAMLAGGLLVVTSGYDLVCWQFGGVMPSPAPTAGGTVAMIVAGGMTAGGVLGGVALVRLGFKIAAEGGTRDGMSAFGALVPVAWCWFRLAWYQLTYTAAVGWTEKFFDFALVIAELLFLFKFARLVSGIGKVGVGEMLFYAVSTAVLALSGLLTRLVLFFSADAEAYAVGAMTGLADLGIGLFAAAVAVGLRYGCYAGSVDVEYSQP